MPINGGTPSVANTSQIAVDGQGRNDTLALDETNGLLTRARLVDGGGDTLIGGDGDDTLLNGEVVTDMGTASPREPQRYRL